MLNEESTPPSKTLTRRIRYLIANLDNASVESSAKQIGGWINSFRSCEDRFRGLLRLAAELVLEKAEEQKGHHSLLGRLCKTLDAGTNGEYSKWLSLAWKEEVRAVGIELLANDAAEAGSWPESIALVAFASELCSHALLQLDSLRSCIRTLSASKSNLGLTVAFTLLEGTWCALCQDRGGKDAFIHAVKTMISASKGDGVCAFVRQQVQLLAVRQISGGIPNNTPARIGWDEETLQSDDDEEGPTNRAISRLCKPKHHQFYFKSGDIVLVCEDASFRVQSDLLSNNSPVFSEMLGRGRGDGDHLSDGRPCIHLFDSAKDFATLLKVFYTPGFPNKHKAPDFAIFSSLLRMSTKYEFEDIRSQLLLDLAPAYPTKLLVYEKTTCRGEALFQAPLPHPNSVLDLLVRCRVTFALPFAYYRASVHGDSASLVTDTGVVFPPDILRKAIHGQARLKKDGMDLASSLAFKNCNAWRCPGNTSSNRSQVFEWILPGEALSGGILEKGDFPGTGYCVQCTQGFSQGLVEAKEKAWKNLPSYFGLTPWSNATYLPN